MQGAVALDVAARAALAATSEASLLAGGAQQVVLPAGARYGVRIGAWEVEVDPSLGEGCDQVGLGA